MPALHVVAADEADWDAAAREVAHELRARFATGSTKTRKWRIKQLRALERFLQEREKEIIGALRADLSRPTMEAIGAEVGHPLSEVRLARKKLRAWMKPERVRTSATAFPGRSYVYREPLGVVLIIGPWNYPVQLLVVPLIGAIAAGNCALLKPSEVAPHTSTLFARWLPRYLDPTAIKVVEGGAQQTKALLEQRWDHILYTGNGAVGRIVMEAAAKHLTPVTLELGGKSPCIVDTTANIDRAARRIVFGKFYNAGQTCLAPDYVLVDDRVHDQLVNAMTAAIREFYGDDPKQSKDFGRIVNQRHHARLVKLLSSGETVVGGEIDAAERYIAPTILRNVQPNDSVMQQEIFGPILPVISVPDVDAAISFVARRPKPLALYIFSNDKKQQERILERTSSGGTTINHVWLHFGVADLPFGGVGASGMGAYHGRASFETFSHRRGVLKKPDVGDPPILYPPYADWKVRWIKRLVS